MTDNWCTGKDFKIIKSKKGIKSVFKNSRGMMAEDYAVMPGGMYDAGHQANNIKRIYIQCNKCKQRFYSSISNCMDGNIYHKLPKHKSK